MNTLNFTKQIIFMSLISAQLVSGSTSENQKAKECKIYQMFGDSDTSITRFDKNKIDLEDKSSEISRIIDYIAENKQYVSKIIINGHSSAKGLKSPNATKRKSKAYNKYISRKRALSVARQLIKKGLSKELIKTRGFGQSRLLDPSQTPEAHKLNRRVEIQVKVSDQFEGTCERLAQVKSNSSNYFQKQFELNQRKELESSLANFKVINKATEAIKNSKSISLSSPKALRDISCPQSKTIYISKDANKVKTMAKFIKELSQKKDRVHSIKILGHSTTRQSDDKRYGVEGSISYNKEKIQERIEIMRNSLLFHGFKKDQVTLANMGHHQPLVRGENEASYDKNRRIEIMTTCK